MTVSAGTDGLITVDNVTTLSGSVANIVTSIGEVDGNDDSIFASTDVIITDAVLEVVEADADADPAVAAAGLGTLITDLSDDAAT